jgi:hypothetical protein
MNHKHGPHCLCTHRVYDTSGQRLVQQISDELTHDPNLPPGRVHIV